MKSVVTFITAFALSATSLASTIIDTCHVSARSDDGNNSTNTVDGDLNTRWSAESSLETGIGQWVQFDLCGAFDLTQMDIAWHKGDERISYFRIETSEDGEIWKRSLTTESTGQSSEFEPFFFESQNTRFVRILSYGNSINDWVSVSEVSIYGTPDQSDYTLNAVTDLHITNATATELTLNWNDNSENVDGYLIEKVLNYSGEYYPYKTVYGTSAQIYNLSRSGTHQFRVSAYKLDDIGPGVEIQTEFSFYSDPVLPASVTASSSDSNIADHVLDGDLDTRWSAKGQGEYITLDFEDRYVIDNVAIAWYKGDERQASFKFYCSADGTTFWPEEDGEAVTSSGNTSNLEAFYQYCDDDGIRFLRIVGYGNTQNDWNSISEIELTGALTRYAN